MIEPHEIALTVLESGHRVVFSNSEFEPEGTSHVRVLDSEGNEIGYWVCDEWQEAPVEVMGAILGALCANRGRTD
jgi:hypothetical protein